MAISEVAVDHTSAQNIANSDAHTAAGSRRQRGRSRFIKDLVGYVVRSIHSVLGLTAGSVFFRMQFPYLRRPLPLYRPQRTSSHAAAAAVADRLRPHLAESTHQR